MIFSKELQDDVRSGAITVSFRLWKRPKVKVGGRYPVGPGAGQIEVDSIELVPFAAITEADVAGPGSRTGRRCGTGPRTRARSTTTPCCTGWSSIRSERAGNLWLRAVGFLSRYEISISAVSLRLEAIIVARQYKSRQNKYRALVHLDPDTAGSTLPHTGGRVVIRAKHHETHRSKMFSALIAGVHDEPVRAGDDSMQLTMTCSVRTPATTSRPGTRSRSGAGTTSARA